MDVGSTGAHAQRRRGKDTIGQGSGQHDRSKQKVGKRNTASGNSARFSCNAEYSCPHQNAYNGGIAGNRPEIASKSCLFHCPGERAKVLRHQSKVKERGRIRHLKESYRNKWSLNERDLTANFLDP